LQCTVRFNTPCGSRERNSGDICALSFKHTNEKKSRGNDGKCSAVQQSRGGLLAAKSWKNARQDKASERERDSKSVHDVVQTLAL
jgi:hypothetical protein